MANSLSNWQNSLNDGLVNRLTRPLRQPGMMKMAMSQRIINRCDRFLNRLPLLNQQMQRWSNSNTLSLESVPIIYAKPGLSTKEQEIENKAPDFKPTIFDDNYSTPITQRKLDITQSLLIKALDDTRYIHNKTDLSTSKVSDEITQFLTLEKQNNPSEIASSTLPVVSSQPVADELGKTSSMPLQAKFTDSPTSTNISRSNFNQPSPPILEERSAINPSEIASSTLPVVSSQPVADELGKTAEIPLLQEFANIPDQPVPIIQAKLQDYSKSQSFLPVVNDSNTLVSPKQTAQNNSSENASSIKQSASIVNTQPVNLSISQINQTSPLPIVTVTSLTTHSSKAQSLPLPLAKTIPSSKSINQPPNLPSPNSISNADSASPTKTFTSPLPPKEISVSPVATQSNIDVDTIASQVERKLMRRLVIESERRGKNQWR